MSKPVFLNIFKNKTFSRRTCRVTENLRCTLKFKRILYFMWNKSVILCLRTCNLVQNIRELGRLELECRRNRKSLSNQILLQPSLSCGYLPYCQVGAVHCHGNREQREVRRVYSTAVHLARFLKLHFPIC